MLSAKPALTIESLKKAFAQPIDQNELNTLLSNESGQKKLKELLQDPIQRVRIVSLDAKLAKNLRVQLSSRNDEQKWKLIQIDPSLIAEFILFNPLSKKLMAELRTQYPHGFITAITSLLQVFPLLCKEHNIIEHIVAEAISVSAKSKQLEDSPEGLRKQVEVLKTRYLQGRDFFIKEFTSYVIDYLEHAQQYIKKYLWLENIFKAVMAQDTQKTQTLLFERGADNPENGLVSNIVPYFTAKNIAKKTLLDLAEEKNNVDIILHIFFSWAIFFKKFPNGINDLDLGYEIQTIGAALTKIPDATIHASLQKLVTENKLSEAMGINKDTLCLEIFKLGIKYNFIAFIKIAAENDCGEAVALVAEHQQIVSGLTNKDVDIKKLAHQYKECRALGGLLIKVLTKAIQEKDMMTILRVFFMKHFTETFLDGLYQICKPLKPWQNEFYNFLEHISGPHRALLINDAFAVSQSISKNYVEFISEAFLIYAVKHNFSQNHNEITDILLTAVLHKDVDHVFKIILASPLYSISLYNIERIGKSLKDQLWQKFLKMSQTDKLGAGLQLLKDHCHPHNPEQRTVLEKVFNVKVGFGDTDYTSGTLGKLCDEIKLREKEIEKQKLNNNNNNNAPRKEISWFSEDAASKSGNKDKTKAKPNSNSDETSGVELKSGLQRSENQERNLKAKEILEQLQEVIFTTNWPVGGFYDELTSTSVKIGGVKSKLVRENSPDLINIITGTMNKMVTIIHDEVQNGGNKINYEAILIKVYEEGHDRSKNSSEEKEAIKGFSSIEGFYKLFADSFEMFFQTIKDNLAKFREIKGQYNNFQGPVDPERNLKAKEILQQLQDVILTTDWPVGGFHSDQFFKSFSLKIGGVVLQNNNSKETNLVTHTMHQMLKTIDNAIKNGGNKTNYEAILKKVYDEGHDRCQVEPYYETFLKKIYYTGHDRQVAPKDVINDFYNLFAGGSFENFFDTIQGNLANFKEVNKKSPSDVINIGRLQLSFKD